VDPSTWFPWRRLAVRGFGLWCDPPYGPAPAGADDATLLAAVGYDVSRLAPAIAAFKRRYAPDEASAGLTDEQRAMARCLIGRRYSPAE
jgi:N-acetylmuramoyl-L-alanine amidase